MSSYEDRMAEKYNFLKKESIPIDITAAGIDADTVIPALSPRYALAPANSIDKSIPKNIAFVVISGNLLLVILFPIYLGGKLCEFNWKLQVWYETILYVKII